MSVPTVKEEVQTLIKQPASAKTKVKLKSGEEIEIFIYPDSEPANRGFICDLHVALKDKAIAGYLKVSYIPKKELAKYYPVPKELLYFAKQIEGKLVDPENLSRRDIDILTDNRIGVMATDTEVQREIEARFRKMFTEFKQWHVDKPKIDYAKVEPTYRRTGIATELYTNAFKYYESNNLPLYASTIQSQSAQALWAHLEEEVFVIKRKKLQGQERREVVGLRGQELSR